MQSQTQEKKSANHKHIILSGGSKGLGYSLTESLLQEGYRVSAFSRHITPSIEKLQENPNYFFAEADNSDSSQLENFCQKAIGKQGAIYGLINNAAIAIDGIFATLPEIEIERMLAVNISGALFLTRLCLRSILASNHPGRIISISSIVGNRGASGLVVYSATKAALEGMTRSLAREVGSKQITVNAIAPGYMQTDLSDSLSNERQQAIIRRTPLGRFTEFSDIHPLVKLLLSNDGQFITGQTIAVDGGLSV